ncbi:MAG TPA: hypothetical protein VIP11_17145 [Gemmatimonadaceae bacterium]
MKRVLLGWIFILHALAHAAIGIWIAADNPPFILTLFWLVALVGFLATGLGLFRAPVLRHVWKPMLATAAMKWGAFVLRPLDSTTTRLIVRTREPGTPSVAGLVLSPFGMFVFEPAHFITQRRMLRGIRDRAEHTSRSPVALSY